MTDPPVPESNAPQPDYPRYVRLLAVAYVLSYAVQFAGFLVLCVAATVLYFRRGGFDAEVVGGYAAALACPVVGGAFRAWFRSFGRRNWPDPDDAEEYSAGMS